MTERELVALDFELVRDEYEDRWARADTDNASIEILDEGVFQVALADGEDTHEVLFAEQGEREVGWCDCDGFTFHTTDGKGPCAHLCTLGKLTVFDEIPVPPVDDLSTPEDADDRDQDDPADDEDPDQVLDEEDDVHDGHGDGRPDDRVDGAEDDRDPELPRRGGGSEAVQEGRDKIVVPEQEQPELPVAGDALDDPLETLPDWMKTKVDQRDGSVDINKRGCQVIANYLGLDVDPEPIKRGHETDFEYAVYEATVRLDGEQVAHAEAEAHVDESNVDKWDLNRMAETRAKKRAVKWATGGGIRAFAESQGEDPKTTGEKLNGDHTVDEEVQI